MLVSRVKSSVAATLPKPFADYLRRKIAVVRQNSRSPREVFSEIYRRNAWGGKAGEFYSGPHFGVEAYTAAIRDFIKWNGIASVLDLACGDFFIGQRVAPACQFYIGADVVPDLIARNTKEFGSERIKFACLDMLSDDLPDADLCLILQALQHLSNRQIATVLRKCRKYRYLIVSEHQPTTAAVFNLDQPQSDGIRLDRGSGVYLDKPPFNARVRLLFETPVTPCEAGPDWGMVRAFRVFL
jgi:SAM-dependent methyltransferase